MKRHDIDGYIQSIYLIEYPDKILLLDGCAKADVPTLIDFFKHTLKRPLNDLKVVLVTHMHPDHAGGAHALRKLTGCKLVSANKNTHWYGGVRGFMMYGVDLCLMRLLVYLKKKPQRKVGFSPYLKPDYKVNEGDFIPEFEDWRILTTEGHTDRDLSAYHEASQTLYVADLLIKVNARYIVPFPLYYPDAYKKSLQKVKQLEPKTLLMAHGGVCEFHERIIDEMMCLAPSHPKTFWLTLKEYALKPFRRLFQHK